MDQSEKRAAIAEAARNDSCPHCHQPLGEERVGSGRFADGVFCSLDCLGTFHDDYFRERIRSLPSAN